MAQDVGGWFAARVPRGWFTEPPRVSADGEEILVVGTLPDVEVEGGDPSRDEGRSARIARFRQESRDQRVAIASEAEPRFGRRVSWGAECGGISELFTTASVPVMTRLRMPERHVL